jgi:hypothetical protein
MSGFTDLDAPHSGSIFGVRAEVGHEIIDVIAQRSLLVIVNAATGTANGIRTLLCERVRELSLHVSFTLNKVPGLAEFLLGFLEASMSLLDVTINTQVGERRSGIRNERLKSLGVELLTHFLLNHLDVLLSGNNVLVDTKVGHEVVDGMAGRLREAGLELVSDVALGFLDTCLSLEDIVVDSEVGHRV